MRNQRAHLRAKITARFSSQFRATEVYAALLGAQPEPVALGEPSNKNRLHFQRDSESSFHCHMDLRSQIEDIHRSRTAAIHQRQRVPRRDLRITSHVAFAESRALNEPRRGQL